VACALRRSAQSKKASSANKHRNTCCHVCAVQKPFSTHSFQTRKVLRQVCGRETRATKNARFLHLRGCRRLSLQYVLERGLEERTRSQQYTVSVEQTHKKVPEKRFASRILLADLSKRKRLQTEVKARAITRMKECAMCVVSSDAPHRHFITSQKQKKHLRRSQIPRSVFYNKNHCDTHIVILKTIEIWLILPVVICLFQGLSHACLRITALQESAHGSLHQTQSAAKMLRKRIIGYLVRNAKLIHELRGSSRSTRAKASADARGGWPCG
jgi:hypothetical protein